MCGSFVEVQRRVQFPEHRCLQSVKDIAVGDDDGHKLQVPVHPRGRARSSISGTPEAAPNQHHSCGGSRVKQLLDDPYTPGMAIVPRRRGQPQVVGFQDFSRLDQPRVLQRARTRARLKPRRRRAACEKVGHIEISRGSGTGGRPPTSSSRSDQDTVMLSWTVASLARSGSQFATAD